MKWISYIEVSPENLDKFIEMYKERVSSGRKSKSLFPPHSIDKTDTGFAGFSIFECDDEMEIAEYVTSYTLAGARVKVYPIVEFSKAIEIYKKIKK